ncbi:hypothetical protein [Nocardia sp. AB354]|uniref:hypothetical protein n=1 Tax=Nocardia sp. AB354 TaxID=3413283 RepID=UPI003C23F2BC
MDLSSTFVGNAKTLLSFGEITVLTDPNFLHRNKHAYPGYGLISRRLPAGPRLPFGLTVTMDGAQGTGLVDLLRLPRAVPVHYEDYTVFASPLGDFRDRMGRRGWADRIVGDRARRNRRAVSAIGTCTTRRAGHPACKYPANRSTS